MSLFLCLCFLKAIRHTHSYMHTQRLLSTSAHVDIYFLSCCFRFPKQFPHERYLWHFWAQEIFHSVFEWEKCTPYTVQKTHTACFCDALMFPVVILSFPVLFQIAQRVFVYGLLIGQHFCMFRFMPPPVLLAWFWVTCFFVFSCRQRHFWNESGKFKTI